MLILWFGFCNSPSRVRALDQAQCLGCNKIKASMSHKEQVMLWKFKVHLSFSVFFITRPREGCDDVISAGRQLLSTRLGKMVFILPNAACIQYLFVQGRCGRMTHFLPGLCPLFSRRGARKLCKLHRMLLLLINLLRACFFNFKQLQ